ncbi:hypothetical protein MRB53_020416 [Persea americana]|uniref:Uncharacterized protein n=1 Tax=Persea americana TaxID=3435 RepID=A0ACC2L0X7_PERAE|nr:hypothetical protein MRB53_020416 [Persea americana]
MRWMNKPISSLLHNCENLKSLKSIHARLLIDGSIFFSDVFLNKILRLYANFGALDHARKLFEKISQPNSFLWTALIHGHVENCLYDDSLLIFRLMLKQSVQPLSFTLLSVLKASARQSRIRDGESIYSLVLKYGLESDPMVQNAVIDMYSRCGEVDIARQVFDGMFGNMGVARALFEQMSVRDSASWNVMVSGYLDAGDLAAASSLFDEMPKQDVGSWNVMISGFCKAGKMNSARELFERMPLRNVASWTMMVDGYIRNGDMKNARCIFDQMPKRNLVSWSTIIAGYAKNGQPNLALDLFNQFKETGIEPDETFILAIISTCSQLGVLDIAKGIISEYVQDIHLYSMQLVTSLIDMHAKCGSVDEALQVFNEASTKDLVCYSTMIAALANHGRGRDAINLFYDMLQSDIKPDGVVFIGVLSACTHGGLINEGKIVFKMMVEDFSIKPSERHYACLVDLLGRAGYLEEAYELIQSMSIEPHSAVWGALLAACRIHRNANLAEVAARHLFKIEPENSGNYILLSNVYADLERWDDVAKVRSMIREQKVRKTRGSSWIELDCVVHEFVMGDMSHFDSSIIYSVLDLLFEDVKNFGCSIYYPTDDAERWI